MTSISRYFEVLDVIGLELISIGRIANRDRRDKGDEAHGQPD